MIVPGDYSVPDVLNARSDVESLSAADGQVVYCAEVDAAYQRDFGSAVPVDGWTSLLPVFGPGRWLLRSDSVSVAPMLWADFATLWVAAAYKVAIYMRAGAWICDSAQTIPSGTEIHAEPGVTITSTLPATGSILTGIFFHVPGSAPGSTLSAPIVIGDTTFDVVSAAPYAIGDWILLDEGFNHTARYQIVNIAGLTITPDRPVMTSFVAGTGVHLSTPAMDIRLYGHGARLAGTGDTTIELSGARECVICDWIVNVAVAETAINLDVGSFRSRIVDCDITATSADSCANLESAESCRMENVYARGALYGLIGTNSFDISFVSCRATECGRGMYLTGGGSSFGARAGSVIGCTFDNCTLFGIELDTFADGWMIDSVRAVLNSTGIAVNGNAGPAKNVMIVNCDVSDNNVGLFIVAGASGLQGRNIVGNRCQSYAVQANGDVEIDGLESRDCALGGLGGGALLAALDARVRISNLTAVKTHNFFWTAIRVDTTATVDVSQSKVTASGANTSIALSHTSTGFSRARQLVATGCTFGWNATAGGLHRGDGLDFSGCATPFAGGQLSFGALVLNGAAAVVHPFAGATAGDRPRARRTVMGAAPGEYTVVVTPGVGITAAALVGDNGTIEVDLE